MTGQTISTRQRFPLFTLVLAMAAAALVVSAVVQHEIRFAVGSLPLWLLVGALFATRSLPAAFTLTETAIEAAGQPGPIPYSEIESISAGGWPVDPLRKWARRHSIEVFHSAGVFEIPERLDVPCDEVYRFLFRQISPRSKKPVHADLARHLQQKQREFGEGRVWSFGARTHTKRPGSSRQSRAVCAALYLSGTAWILYGITTTGGEAWTIVGCFLLGLTTLCALTFFLLARQRDLLARVKGGRASLVVAPDGLAVLQGDLRGELHWGELLDATFNSNRLQWGSEAGILPGIHLKVDGASILLRDVYDRPLPLIYHQIFSTMHGGTKAVGPEVPEPRPTGAGERRIATGNN